MKKIIIAAVLATLVSVAGFTPSAHAAVSKSLSDPVRDGRTSATYSGAGAAVDIVRMTYTRDSTYLKARFQVRNLTWSSYRFTSYDANGRFDAAGTRSFSISVLYEGTRAQPWFSRTASAPRSVASCRRAVIVSSSLSGDAVAVKIPIRCLPSGRTAMLTSTSSATRISDHRNLSSDTTGRVSLRIR